jgi:hypothetical protein
MRAPRVACLILLLLKGGGRARASCSAWSSYWSPESDFAKNWDAPNQVASENQCSGRILLRSLYFCAGAFHEGYEKTYDRRMWIPYNGDTIEEWPAYPTSDNTALFSGFTLADMKLRLSALKSQEVFFTSRGARTPTPRGKLSVLKEPVEGYWKGVFAPSLHDLFVVGLELPVTQDDKDAGNWQDGYPDLYQYIFSVDEMKSVQDGEDENHIDAVKKLDQSRDAWTVMEVVYDEPTAADRGLDHMADGGWTGCRGGWPSQMRLPDGAHLQFSCSVAGAWYTGSNDGTPRDSLCNLICGDADPSSASSIKTLFNMPAAAACTPQVTMNSAQSALLFSRGDSWQVTGVAPSSVKVPLWPINTMYRRVCNATLSFYAPAGVSMKNTVRFAKNSGKFWSAVSIAVTYHIPKLEYETASSRTLPECAEWLRDGRIDRFVWRNNALVAQPIMVGEPSYLTLLNQSFFGNCTGGWYTGDKAVVCVPRIALLQQICARGGPTLVPIYAPGDGGGWVCHDKSIMQTDDSECPPTLHSSCGHLPDKRNFTYDPTKPPYYNCPIHPLRCGAHGMPAGGDSHCNLQDHYFCVCDFGWFGAFCDKVGSQVSISEHSQSAQHRLKIVEDIREAYNLKYTLSGTSFLRVTTPPPTTTTTTTTTSPATTSPTTAPVVACAECEGLLDPKNAGVLALFRNTYCLANGSALIYLEMATKAVCQTCVGNSEDANSCSYENDLLIARNTSAVDYDCDIDKDLTFPVFLVDWAPPQSALTIGFTDCTLAGIPADAGPTLIFIHGKTGQSPLSQTCDATNLKKSYTVSDWSQVCPCAAGHAGKYCEPVPTTAPDAVTAAPVTVALDATSCHSAQLGGAISIDVSSTEFYQAIRYEGPTAANETWERNISDAASPVTNLVKLFITPDTTDPAALTCAGLTGDRTVLVVAIERYTIGLPPPPPPTTTTTTSTSTTSTTTGFTTSTTEPTSPTSTTTSTFVAPPQPTPAPTGQGACAAHRALATAGCILAVWGAQLFVGVVHIRRRNARERRRVEREWAARQPEPEPEPETEAEADSDTAVLEMFTPPVTVPRNYAFWVTELIRAAGAALLITYAWGSLCDVAGGVRHDPGDHSVRLHMPYLAYRAAGSQGPPRARLHAPTPASWARGGTGNFSLNVISRPRANVEQVSKQASARPPALYKIS